MPYMKMLRAIKSNLTWANLSRLHSSPIAKLSALMPIAGYLFLFSEAFPQITEYVSLDTEGALFSAEHRLLLIYFGGLFIAFSMFLHFVFCPRYAKKYSDPDEIRDQFIRFGSPMDVFLAVFEAANRRYLFGRNSKRVSRFQNSFSDYCRIGRTTAAFNGLLASDGWIALWGAVSNQQKFKVEDRRKFFNEQLSPILGLHVAGAEDDKRTERAVSTLTHLFDESNSSRPIILFLSITLAFFGSTFLFIPAIETFYLVVKSILPDSANGIVNG